MPRMVDADCSKCGRTIRDKFYLRTPDIIRCECGAKMEERWLPAPKNAQWNEREGIVVFKKPDGTFSFPARSDKPTPAGCERIVARSDRELAKIEAMTGTRNESRWFEKGSGRGFDC